jgi:hypothetical protein
MADEYGSGDLNPQAPRLVSREYTSQSTYDTFVRDACMSVTQEDILSNAGPWKAKVLRVWKEDGENSNAGFFWSLFTDGVAGEIVFIKAWIPELSSCKGPGYEPAPDDHKAVEMCPTFVAARTNMPAPQVGTLVKVDFEDRRNLTFPIYLGPANSSNEQMSDQLTPAQLISAQQSFSSGKRYDAQNLPSDIKTDQTNVSFKEPQAYKENRIRVFAFGALPVNSPLLVSVPSTKSKGQKVHKLVASRLKALNEAWTNETGKSAFLVASGHRRHRWNHDFEYYKKKIIEEYKSKYPAGTSDAQVFRKGSGLKAFMSPHETGLAVDFGNNGLVPETSPSRGGRPIGEQRNTAAHIWLKNNAHFFGFTPYKFEPWHWECLVPRENWKSGEEFSPMATRIVEVSKTPYPENVKDNKGRSYNVKGQQLATTDEVFAVNKFV